MIKRNYFKNPHTHTKKTKIKKAGNRVKKKHEGGEEGEGPRKGEMGRYIM